MSAYNVTEWFLDNCEGVYVNGQDINCRCPVCGDSEKNKHKKRFHYNLSTDVFHCFNCDVSGHGLKGVFFKLGLSTSDLFNYRLGIGSDFKGNITDGLQKVNEKKPVVDLDSILRENSNTKSRLIEVFREKRHIQKDYPLLFGTSPYHNFYHRIIIPFVYQEKFIYYQARSVVDSDIKYLNPDIDKEDLPIFLEDRFDSNHPIIIVEGIVDPISTDIPNMTTGFGVPSEHYVEKILKKNKNVILALDNDDAGWRKLRKLGDVYQNQVKYFCWADAVNFVKDFNDLVVDYNMYGITLFKYILSHTYNYEKMRVLNVNKYDKTPKWKKDKETRKNRFNKT